MRRRRVWMHGLSILLDCLRYGVGNEAMMQDDATLAWSYVQVGVHFYTAGMGGNGEACLL